MRGERVGEVSHLRNTEFLFVAGPHDRVEAALAVDQQIERVVRPRGVADVNVYTPERVEARYGEPGDYAGPDLLAEWYRRAARQGHCAPARRRTPHRRRRRCW